MVAAVAMLGTTLPCELAAQHSAGALELTSFDDHHLGFSDPAAERGEDSADGRGHSHSDRRPCCHDNIVAAGGAPSAYEASIERGSTAQRFHGFTSECRHVTVARSARRTLLLTQLPRFPGFPSVPIVLSTSSLLL